MTFIFGALPPAPAALTIAAATAAKLTDGAAGTRPHFGRLFAPAPHRQITIEGFDSGCAGVDDGARPCCPHRITPRLAWLLHAGAHAVLESWTAGAGQGQDCLERVLREWLPPAALSYAGRAPGWLERVCATVRDLALRLEAGQELWPSNTAEAVALYIALGQADAHLESMNDDRLHEDWGGLKALPAHNAAGGHEDDVQTGLWDALDFLRIVALEHCGIEPIIEGTWDGTAAPPAFLAHRSLLLPENWFETWDRMDEPAGDW